MEGEVLVKQNNQEPYKRPGVKTFRKVRNNRLCTLTQQGDIMLKEGIQAHSYL